MSGSGWPYVAIKGVCKSKPQELLRQIAGACCCRLAGVSTLLAARTSKGTSLLLDDMAGHLQLLSRLPSGSPVVRW